MTVVESATVQPLVALVTLNISGCPVKPPPEPAVIDDAASGLRSRGHGGRTVGRLRRIEDDVAPC